MQKVIKMASEKEISRFIKSLSLVERPLDRSQRRVTAQTGSARKYFNLCRDTGWRKKLLASDTLMFVLETGTQYEDEWEGSEDAREGRFLALVGRDAHCDSKTIAKSAAPISDER
jgi:hypothetical protein